MIRKHYLLKVTRHVIVGQEQKPDIQQKSFFFLKNAKKRLKEQYEEEKKAIAKVKTYPPNFRFYEKIKDDYVNLFIGSETSWMETEWFVM